MKLPLFFEKLKRHNKANPDERITPTEIGRKLGIGRSLMAYYANPKEPFILSIDKGRFNVIRPASVVKSFKLSDLTKQERATIEKIAKG